MARLERRPLRQPAVLPERRVRQAVAPGLAERGAHRPPGLVHPDLSAGDGGRRGMDYPRARRPWARLLPGPDAAEPRYRGAADSAGLLPLLRVHDLLGTP